MKDISYSGSSEEAAPATEHSIAHVDGLEGSVLLVWGTFVGTWALQVSANGTDWVACKDRNGTALTGQTGTGFWSLVGWVPFVRFNTSEYTSGTINYALMGNRRAD